MGDFFCSKCFSCYSSDETIYDNNDEGFCSRECADESNSDLEPEQQQEEGL